MIKMTVWAEYEDFINKKYLNKEIQLPCCLEELKQYFDIDDLHKLELIDIDSNLLSREYLTLDIYEINYLATKIKSIGDDDFEALKNMAIICNNHDGSFDELIFYNADELINEKFSDKVIEFANAIHYGRYNCDDEYARIDEYGHIETISSYDYEIRLMDYSEDIIYSYFKLIEKEML